MLVEEVPQTYALGHDGSVLLGLVLNIHNDQPGFLQVDLQLRDGMGPSTGRLPRNNPRHGWTSQRFRIRWGQLYITPVVGDTKGETITLHMPLLTHPKGAATMSVSFIRGASSEDTPVRLPLTRISAACCLCNMQYMVGSPREVRCPKQESTGSTCTMRPTGKATLWSFATSTPEATRAGTPK